MISSNCKVLQKKENHKCDGSEIENAQALTDSGSDHAGHYIFQTGVAFNGLWGGESGSQKPVRQSL